jgi:hypothetical protein
MSNSVRQVFDEVLAVVVLPVILEAKLHVLYYGDEGYRSVISNGSLLKHAGNYSPHFSISASSMQVVPRRIGALHAFSCHSPGEERLAVRDLPNIPGPPSSQL